MMPSPVIDVHAHAFPAIRPLIGPMVEGILPERTVFKTLDHARKMARSWMQPFTTSSHKTQTLLRHLPEPLRKGIDQVAGFAAVPGLLVESSVEDLLESMELNEVDQALLIAHPPVISNEFILEACQDEPRLIPIVNLSRDTEKPAQALKNFVKKGARGLKIHTASDGEKPDSRRYLDLLKVANELGLFVILHTGCIHSHLIFKDPNASRAEMFTPWFKDFPELTFILAHMNFHEPRVAMDLVNEFSNVHVDTSWQPAETIAEAVRCVGPERVMFGSDWPLIGDNLAIGRKRIDDCVETGLISVNDAKKILGENAVRLLKL